MFEKLLEFLKIMEFTCAKIETRNSLRKNENLETLNISENAGKGQGGSSSHVGCFEGSWRCDSEGVWQSSHVQLLLLEYSWPATVYKSLAFGKSRTNKTDRNGPEENTEQILHRRHPVQKQ